MKLWYPESEEGGQGTNQGACDRPSQGAEERLQVPLSSVWCHRALVKPGPWVWSPSGRCGGAWLYQAARWVQRRVQPPSQAALPGLKYDHIRSSKCFYLQKSYRTAGKKTRANKSAAKSNWLYTGPCHCQSERDLGHHHRGGLVLRQAVIKC